MGTRSIIRFEEEGKHIVDIYRQFDGYPEGRGKDLAEFLAGGQIVNGIGSDAKFGKIFNGMGDLAAQWINHEKDYQVGNVYVQPRHSIQALKDSWIEYFYLVQKAGNELIFTCKEVPSMKIIFTTKKGDEALDLITAYTERS